MRDGLIVGDLQQPSIVYGVHGTSGDSQWKCLARRTGLHGAWEAVEWAWLPPGGISGEHQHHRTEEVYFILTGQGEMLINGERHVVEPGHLILNGLGTQHGLRNIGHDGLGWLVIELLSPTTHAVLNHGQCDPKKNSNKETAMTAEIINLRQVGEVDPSTVFTGPLKKIQLVNLQAGQQSEINATGFEYTLFIINGEGKAASPANTSVPLEYGVALTLPLTGSLSITAGDNGLEYFLATLEVPTGGTA